MKEIVGSSKLFGLVLLGCLIRSEVIISNSDSSLVKPELSYRDSTILNGIADLVPKPSESSTIDDTLKYDIGKLPSDNKRLPIEDKESEKDNAVIPQVGQNFAPSGIFTSGQQNLGGFGPGQNTGGQPQSSQFVPPQQSSNFMPPPFIAQQPQSNPVQSYPQTTFPNPMTFPIQNQNPPQPPINFPVVQQTPPPIQMQPPPPQTTPPQIIVQPNQPQILVQPPPQQPQILLQQPQPQILVQQPQPTQNPQQIVIQQPQPQILLQQQQHPQIISYPVLQSPPQQQAIISYPVIQQPQIISYPVLQQPEITNFYPHNDLSNFYPHTEIATVYPHPEISTIYPFKDNSQLCSGNCNQDRSPEPSQSTSQSTTASLSKGKGCYRNGDRTQPCYPAHRCPPCWSLDIRDNAYQCFDYVRGTANVCPVGVDTHHHSRPVIQAIPYPLPLTSEPHWGLTEPVGFTPTASPQVTPYSVCFINGNAKMPCTGSMCPPCWDYKPSLNGYSCRDFMSNSLRCNVEGGPKTSIDNFNNMQYGHINYYRQATCYTGGVLSHPCHGPQCPSCWKFNFITKRASCYSHVNTGGSYNCPIWDGVIDLVKLGFFPGPPSPNIHNDTPEGYPIQSTEGYPDLNNMQGSEVYPMNQYPAYEYPNSASSNNYYPEGSNNNYTPSSDSNSVYYPNLGDAAIGLASASAINSDLNTMDNIDLGHQLNRQVNETLIPSSPKNTTTVKGRIPSPHRRRNFN